VDWARFEQAMADAVVDTVRATVAQRPEQHFYAAAFGEIYAETDGVITLPMFGMNSVEALLEHPDDERDDLRWSLADWVDCDLDWLPAQEHRRWQEAITGHARRGSTRQWDDTFGRYLTALVTACRQARRRLRDEGAVDQDFVVLVFHNDDPEALLRALLSAAEMRRLFPVYDQRHAELARVAALPPAGQARYYASRLGVFDGPVTGEEAARALLPLGRAAAEELLPRLRDRGRAWEAAKLLADLGRPDADVIDALTAAVRRLDGSDLRWAACALARLGRLDVVLGQALPQDVVAAAVAAPYKSFRDHGQHPPPLDYAPLEDVLTRRPELAAGLDDELKPGVPPCQITAAEVGAALGGLRSPHALVRRHAVTVLGDRALGPAEGRRVLPALCRTAADDPDPSVRRLAVLSLRWWQRDAHPYADTVRTALDDPDPAVRSAAAGTLRELEGDPPA
jgi:hypothetical protein